MASTVNSFAQKENNKYTHIPEELKKLIAVYAVCETNVTDLDDFDKVVERVKESINSDNRYVDEILESYERGNGVPSRLLGNARGAMEGKVTEAAQKRDAYVAKRIANQDKVVSRERLVDASVGAPDEVYAALVFFGALWYSGYLSTVLSTLGWHEVKTAIDEIALGKEIGKEPKRMAVIKGIAGALRKRATTTTTTAFGASDDVLLGLFMQDQADRADADDPSHAGTNSLGVTSTFLAAYIRKRYAMAKSKYEIQMKAEHDDVVRFRLIVDAVVAVLPKLMWHIHNSFRAFEVHSAHQLFYAVSNLLVGHTGMPNTKTGSFQRLHAHLQTVTLTGPAAASSDGSEHITTEEMLDLVARLATAERAGVFMKVFSTTTKSSQEHQLPLLGALLKAMFRDYKDRTSNEIFADYGKDGSGKEGIRLLHLILKALKQENVLPMKAAALTFTSVDADTKDEFYALLDTMLVQYSAHCTIERYSETDVAPIFERASGSVSEARRAVYKGTFESHLQDLIAEVSKLITEDDRKSGVKPTLFDLACLALTRNATSAAWEDAMLNPKDAHTLRRELLTSFLDETRLKNAESTSKLLVMFLYLMRLRVRFNDAIPTPREIFDLSSRNVFSDMNNFARLRKITGDAYFDVQDEHIADYEIMFVGPQPDPYHIYARFPSKFVSQFDVGTKKKLDELVQLRVRKMRAGSDTVAESRAIDELLSRHPPRARLLVDRLTSLSQLEKNKDERIKKQIAELQQEHEELEKLLGVSFAAARAGSAPDNRDTVYGVFFKHDDSVGQKLEPSWRLYVHANVDAKSIRSSLYKLIERAYDKAKLDVNRVVFGRDEWPDNTLQKDAVLRATTGIIKLLELPTLKDADTATKTLFVHRWPEMEFIPAPYGFATPMFHHPPPTFTHSLHLNIGDPSGSTGGLSGRSSRGTSSPHMPTGTVVYLSDGATANVLRFDSNTNRYAVQLSNGMTELLQRDQFETSAPLKRGAAATPTKGSPHPLGGGALIATPGGSPRGALHVAPLAHATPTTLSLSPHAHPTGASPKGQAATPASPAAHASPHATPALRRGLSSGMPAATPAQAAPLGAHASPAAAPLVHPFAQGTNVRISAASPHKLKGKAGTVTSYNVSMNQYTLTMPGEKKAVPVSSQYVEVV